MADFHGTFDMEHKTISTLALFKNCDSKKKTGAHIRSILSYNHFSEIIEFLRFLELRSSFNRWNLTYSQQIFYFCHKKNNYLQESSNYMIFEAFGTSKSACSLKFNNYTQQPQISRTFQLYRGFSKVFLSTPRQAIVQLRLKRFMSQVLRQEERINLFLQFPQCN